MEERGKLLKEALLEFRLELVLISDARSRFRPVSLIEILNSFGGEAASDGMGDGLLTEIAIEDSELILLINIYMLLWILAG